MTEHSDIARAPAAIGRRDFIRLAGSTAAGWLALGATPERMRIVGLLIGFPLSDQLASKQSPDGVKARFASLIKDLNDRGWVEGVNIRFEPRSSYGGPANQQAAVKQLLELNPDVILTSSTVETALIATATKTIPIVFATASDPVGNGFAQSLAHPGGNITGFTNSDPEMGGKWLQLLKEIDPRIERVGALFNPDTAPRGGRFFLDSIESEAASTGIKVTPVPMHDPSEIEDAVRSYSGSPAGGLIGLADSFLVINRAAVVAATAKYRVPMIYPFRYFVDSGGLIAYGAALEVRSGEYVDLILRGTKPGDLPVQSPRKYELLINRKSADALGLKLSPALLARADEIRE
jgi:putative tryptophan/tyrosine transport system substrate-binding protein